MSHNHLESACSPLFPRRLSSVTSSPTSSSHNVTDEDFPRKFLSQDLSQEDKDVLLKRFTDLAACLSGVDSLKNSDVATVHMQLDHIEDLIRNREGLHTLLEILQKESRLPDSGHDIFWEPPISTQNPDTVPILQPQSMPSFRAIDVVKVAEDLTKNLASTLAELQTRKKEAAHIHDILVMKLETAAQRIIFLERRMNEMEDDNKACKSELRYLRNQLQAMEAMKSRGNSPIEAQNLNHNILNWKLDWDDNTDKLTKVRKRFIRDSKSTSTITSWDGTRSYLEDSTVSPRVQPG